MRYTWVSQFISIDMRYYMEVYSNKHNAKLQRIDPVTNSVPRAKYVFYNIMPKMIFLFFPSF